MFEKFNSFLSQSYFAKADGFTFTQSGCMSPVIDKEMRDVALISPT